MVEIPGAGPQIEGLVQRAKAILLKPVEEWPRIEAEQTSISDVFLRYAVPLAAIGPVCTLIGSQLFGYGAFGFSFRPSLTGALGMAVTSYVMSLVSLFVVTFIASFLSGKFGGTPDTPRAFKLVAYSMTAGWVVGIFGLIPMLGILAILGLYGIYLFYTGAGVLMKVPQEKAGSYTAVTIVAAILLYFIVGAVTGAIAGRFAGNPFGHGMISSSDSSSVTMPGMGSINVGEMERAAKRMEDQATGKTKPVDSASLQSLLPSSISSFARTGTETMAVGGIGGAEATYENGEHRFDLRITDTNALGAIAGMGVAMGMERTRESADGYERTGVVDGRMQTEKWRNASDSGTFGVMVGDRFMVQAEGHVPSIDVLKAAVASVDEASLAALAR